MLSVSGEGSFPGLGEQSEGAFDISQGKFHPRFLWVNSEVITDLKADVLVWIQSVPWALNHRV